MVNSDLPLSVIIESVCVQHQFPLSALLYVAEVLGEFEFKFPYSNDLNLRFLTPLVKLFTAKEAMKQRYFE